MPVLGRLGRLGVYASQPSTCRRLGVYASQSQCLLQRGYSGWVYAHPQLLTEQMLCLTSWQRSGIIKLDQAAFADMVLVDEVDDHELSSSNLLFQDQV